MNAWRVLISVDHIVEALESVSFTNFNSRWCESNGGCGDRKSHVSKSIMLNEKYLFSASATAGVRSPQSHPSHDDCARDEDASCAKV